MGLGLGLGLGLASEGWSARIAREIKKRLTLTLTLTSIARDMQKRLTLTLTLTSIARDMKKRRVKAKGLNERSWRIVG